MAGGMESDEVSAARICAHFAGCAAARRRWPGAPLTRVRDHGRAEALFLALVAMRQNIIGRANCLDISIIELQGEAWRAAESCH